MQSPRNKRFLAIPAVVFTLVVFVALGFVMLKPKHAPTVSATLQEQINFPIYVMPDTADSATWRNTSKDVSYDPTSGVFTVIFHKGSDSVTFKEQATPDPFTDIPNYYAKLLDKLQQYLQFSTNKGTVTLTRPKELNGAQAASMNPLGTLIFATPNRDMNKEEWTALFNQLIVLK